MDLYWILQWSENNLGTPLDPPVEDQTSSGAPLEIQKDFKPPLNDRIEYGYFEHSVELRGFCPPDHIDSCNVPG